ncbi:MAG: ABC transporter permease [Candidatus Riflebacteria bacterium]|nr:ABC transporter permease [Candidatus Riflebacteria bacterium]
MSILSNTAFFFREALTNSRRAVMMTAITISTIAVSLLLMGGFLLGSLHLEAFLKRLQNEAMVTAFMAPTVGEIEVSQLKERISQMGEVGEVKIITPNEAISELFLDKEDQKLFGMSGSDNPLPYSVRIKVKSEKMVEELVQKLKGFSGVESVFYGEEAFKRFKGVSDLFWAGTLIVIVFLGLASFFIVYNTISLTLFLRREEIIIMRLVGATNWFIRWPFLIEGMIQGLIGALVAVFLLIVSYKFIVARIGLLVPFFYIDIDFSQIFKLSVKLLMVGIVLGISGSLFSLRDLTSFSKNEIK